METHIPLKYFSALHQAYIELSISHIRSCYGGNLIALAVFGSYARQEPRLNSDLDLLLILRKAPSRRERLNEFMIGVELPAEPLSQRLYEEEGILCELSPYIVNWTEALRFHPIYADMTEQCIVLHDPDRTVSRILHATRKLLAEHRACKVRRNNSWEWQFNRYLGGVVL